MLKTGRKNRYVACIFSVYVLFIVVSSPVYAETDFSWFRNEALIKELEGILAGTSGKGEDYIEHRCGTVVTDYLWTEQSKVEFNHLFHEIDSEEQQQDVKRLAEKVAKTKSCKRHIKLWLEYDAKWYAQKRAEEKTAWEKRQGDLLAGLQDTGADVWDGVINSAVLAIPLF